MGDSQERRSNVVWWFSPLLDRNVNTCFYDVLDDGEIHRRGDNIYNSRSPLCSFFLNRFKKLIHVGEITQGRFYTLLSFSPLCFDGLVLYKNIVRVGEITQERSYIFF